MPHGLSSCHGEGMAGGVGWDDRARFRVRAGVLGRDGGSTDIGRRTGRDDRRRIAGGEGIRARVDAGAPDGLPDLSGVALENLRSTLRGRHHAAVIRWRERIVLDRRHEGGSQAPRWSRRPARDGKNGRVIARGTLAAGCDAADGSHEPWRGRLATGATGRRRGDPCPRWAGRRDPAPQPAPAVARMRASEAMDGER